MEALREEIYDHTSDPAQESFRNQQYQRSSMQRSAIVDRLRREGCRITKQRKIILDIILQEECTCCKEIYFLASKKDPNIGMATVYRMINLLEEIGALKRYERQIKNLPVLLVNRRCFCFHYFLLYERT